ncbi:MAG: Spy/CpxP family protein refolding chaperone [Deltaproteobacteria bacterium]|jgi:Spy/CpxP family protein refolding chaperone|nr:Spy/CpxP family protein refolding chaperone [Deltaproteobacteria bacterium]
MVKKGLTISLICVFILAALIFNGCRSHSANHKAEFMVDYIAETLDLSDAQRVQLDEIKEEFLARAKEMHAQKEAMHAEFKAELLKEEIDQQRVRELMAQKREQMTEMMDLAVARLAEFHKTLSPEQKEKLVAKLEWFHQKHQHNWQ